MLAPLVLVLLTAQFIYSNKLYITGDGGPAGPDFNCLTWDEPFVSGAYGDNIFTLCTFMSIPSFNKFLIDQSIKADRTDDSATYYITLAANEAIILGGLVLGIKKYKKGAKPSNQSKADD